MKKILYTLSAVLLLAAADAEAQQVKTEVIDGKTYYVIDCSAMPAKARRPATYTSDPYTSVGAIPHTTVDDWNRVAYQKFAVSMTDVKSYGGEITMSYPATFNACNAYVGPGDKKNTWRLPTQRELLLMWTMKTKLEAQSGFTAFSSNKYWSSTESSLHRGNVHIMYLNNGSMYSLSMASGANKAFLRCVREF